jgi:GNAT superfamily N-acetyltransferase
MVHMDPLGGDVSLQRGTFALVAAAVASMVAWLVGRFFVDSKAQKLAVSDAAAAAATAVSFDQGFLVLAGPEGSGLEVRALLPGRHPLNNAATADDTSAGPLSLARGGVGALYAAVAALVDAEWPGSGPGIERGVALTKDAATLILGERRRQPVGGPLIAERHEPRRSNLAEFYRAQSVALSANAAGWPRSEAVNILGYVRVEAAPGNVRAAHAASDRGHKPINGASDSTATTAAIPPCGPWKDPVMVVQGLVVAAEARGRGLGRLLMAAVDRAVRGSRETGKTT